MDFSIEQFWYRSDGSLLSRQTSRYSIEADWGGFFASGSWGWNNVGNWPAGTYRVELYIGGQQVASGSFKIYAAPNDAIAANNGRKPFLPRWPIQ